MCQLARENPQELANYSVSGKQHGELEFGLLVHQGDLEATCPVTLF
jgi:hypothetical protein